MIILRVLLEKDLSNTNDLPQPLHRSGYYVYMRAHTSKVQKVVHYNRKTISVHSVAIEECESHSHARLFPVPSVYCVLH